MSDYLKSLASQMDFVYLLMYKRIKNGHSANKNINRIPSGFRDSAIYSEISGFIFQSGFKQNKQKTGKYQDSVPPINHDMIFMFCGAHLCRFKNVNGYLRSLLDDYHYTQSSKLNSRKFSE